MKRLLYILTLALSVAFFSCEKDEIVIVNPVEDERTVETKSGTTDIKDGEGSDSGSSGTGTVTDPNDPENLDYGKKGTGKNGKNGK